MAFREDFKRNSSNVACFGKIWSNSCISDGHLSRKWNVSVFFGILAFSLREGMFQGFFLKIKSFDLVRLPDLQR